MTAHERIEAAIAAHLQATPGPWMFIHGNKIIDNSGEVVALVVGKWKQNEMEANRDTISAAPDLVDEVILLRKWQQEALPYLHREIEQCKIVLGIGICECEVCTAAKIRGKQLNRLIAEAQGGQGMTTNEHIKAAFIETDNFKFHHECANEIERLRDWQQEAVRWLVGARTIMDVVGAPKDMKDNLDRLIAEAQEDKNA